VQLKSLPDKDGSNARNICHLIIKDYFMWSNKYLIANADYNNRYKDKEKLPCSLRHHCYNSQKLDCSEDK